MRLPCCAHCRLVLQLGEPLVFRRDGRVEHVACPEVICPMCHRAIVPGRPILTCLASPAASAQCSRKASRSRSPTAHHRAGASRTSAASASRRASCIARRRARRPYGEAGIRVRPG